MKYSAPMMSMCNKLSVDFAPSPDKPSRNIVIELIKVTESVINMEKLILSKNPTQAAGAHALKVSAAAKKLETYAGSIENRVNEIKSAAIRSLEQSIAEKSALLPHPHGPEIRAALRAMKSKERNAALRSALDAGDSTTLSAIAEGNQITTGIDGQVREAFLNAHRLKMAPDEFKELENINNIVSTAPIVIEQAYKSASKAVDPSYIESIKQEEDAALNAEREFNQAVA